MELFGRDKIPFINITDRKYGYIEKKDDSLKTVLVSRLSFHVPDDKGYIEIESHKRTVGDIKMGGKVLDEVTPRLVLPKNLEAQSPFFESLSVIGDKSSAILWNECLDDAMEIAFNTAQSINDTSIVIEDDEWKKHFLCIPIDLIDGSKEYIREISKDVVFKEKLKLFEKDFNYRGIYFLEGDIPLFEVEGHTVDFVGQLAAEHLFLLESYNQLKLDECLGIDETERDDDTMRPYKLLAAKLEDGELKIREVNNSHGNFLLFSANNDMPFFRIYKNMLIGDWIEEKTPHQWSGRIKDKNGLLDSFIEWAEAMEKSNISSSMFGISPTIQEELNILNLSRTGTAYETRDKE